MNKNYQIDASKLPLGVRIIAYIAIIFSTSIVLIMILKGMGLIGILEIITNFDKLTLLFLINISYSLSSILMLSKKRFANDILSFTFISSAFYLFVKTVNKEPETAVFFSSLLLMMGLYLLLKRKVILNVIKQNKEKKDFKTESELPIDYRILARIISYSTIFYSVTSLSMILATIVYYDPINAINNLVKDPDKNSLLIFIALNFSLFILSILMIMGKKLANYLLASLYIILSAFISYYKIMPKISFFEGPNISLSIILLFFGVYLIFRSKCLDLIKKN